MSPPISFKVEMLAVGGIVLMHTVTGPKCSCSTMVLLIHFMVWIALVCDIEHRNHACNVSFKETVEHSILTTFLDVFGNHCSTPKSPLQT